MKVMIINGSPRKNGNTGQLCQKAKEGAESKNANVELVNLYDYTFKGCISCFGCHLKKNNDNPLCLYKDDIRPILEKCIEADAIVIGSPIYYGSISGYTQSFLERLLFAADTYYINEEGERVSKIKRNIKIGMIYTMNVPKEMKDLNGEGQLEIMRGYLTNILGECESLYSCDTYQFKNYDLYLNNMFDPEHKKEMREKQFPIDCKEAYELGERMCE